ncbi:MAG: tetratricopeptide repeat protein [Chlorobiaceae bacterium]|nr:tetratricopeptide repeat protein [Chlorobiaceae bacterium]
MVREFVKYNPAFLESDRLVENFVVRQSDLEMIVRIVRDNTASSSNQHVLVIGPRGSGKTTLVRRVSAEIVSDEALNTAWYPLIFAEESYNALSSADFWLESLFHLAEQTGELRWRDSYHELRRDHDEKRLAQRALGQLLDYADSIGKRILLVVENLDMLLSEFSSETEAWALRHTLMNEPRLMLLATATVRFEEIDHPAHAMFEMFRIHELRALNDEECNAIWALVAGTPLPGMQIRPVRILTGGNARLIALIARYGAKRSFRELHEELIDLIDEHTDYFKGHLDTMAPVERKVYLALAELWKQSTAKEIAEVARLDVNTTSALLKRLASREKVSVEDEGKRKKWYSVSEGIYNIYYLMRRRGGPSARVKAAVRFMVILYDVVPAAKLLLDESCTLEPEECRDHLMAFGQIYRSAMKSQQFELAKIVPSAILGSPHLDSSIREEMMAYQSSCTLISDEVERIMEEMKQIATKEQNLIEQKQYEAILEICQNLVDNYGDRQETAIETQVARAMGNKAVALFKMGRFEDAVRAYDAVAEKYGDRQEVQIVEQVAKAVVNKGFSYGKLKQFYEAVTAYEELVTRYADRQEARIVNLITKAIYNKGCALYKMGRFEEAISTYEEVFENYGDRKEPEIAEQVAKAMVNKGVALGYMNRFEEAVIVCDELIVKYGDRHEVSISKVVLIGRILLSGALLQLGRKDEAFATVRTIVSYAPFPEEEFERFISVCVEFAAYGHAEELLEVIIGSPVEHQLETLVAGLRLYCGQEVRTATEILEVAKDVVKRIEARRREIEAWKSA